VLSSRPSHVGEATADLLEPDQLGQYAAQRLHFLATEERQALRLLVFVINRSPTACRSTRVEQ
jgi:hypothetical protein